MADNIQVAFAAMDGNQSAMSSVKPLSRRGTTFLSCALEGSDDNHGEDEDFQRYMESRLSRAKKRITGYVPINEFDPESDYNFDFDSDDEAAKLETLEESVESNSVKRYRQACQNMKFLPSSGVAKQLGRNALVLKDMCLSPTNLKAIFIVISGDADTVYIDLSGNQIRPKESSYLVQVLSRCRRLTCLELENCSLSGKSLSLLSEEIKHSKSLSKLNLSGNDLIDRDCASLVKILKENESIKELILKKNKLGECGVELGRAIGENSTVTDLDLSWNHIRGMGAVGIAMGVQKNSCIVNLILSWNGFGYEGSVALKQVLSRNTTLTSLDLSNNRIHQRALFEILGGLATNKTLLILKLGYNPIPASMTSIFLNRILQAKESSLRELYLECVIVDKEFEPILAKIRQKREMTVVYDKALPLNKSDELTAMEKKNVFNIDPIKILFFMKEHLRTIDMFLRFDRDSSNLLTRDEMHYVFEICGYPISSSSMDKVMDYLDTNKDGDVDLLNEKLETEIEAIEELIPVGFQLREFMNGERKLKRKLLRERTEEQTRVTKSPISDKIDVKKYSQTYEQVAKLPTISR